jgi:hypothetical protein
MAPAFVAAKIKALTFNIRIKYTLFSTAKDTISRVFCLFMSWNAHQPVQKYPTIDRVNLKKTTVCLQIDLILTAYKIISQQ